MHLFVGAGRAPSLPSRQPMLHTAPDSEFLDVIRRLGGLPTEIVHNATTMRFFLPFWRGDFSLAASHVYVPEEPLACSISAFGGEQDEIVPPEDLQAWKEETSGSFSVRMFPDGHFFLRKYAAQLLQAISRDLATYSHIHFD